MFGILFFYSLYSVRVLVQHEESIHFILEVMFMKKRLVAYLMVSALAVSVLAGCGGKGKGGDAGDAADAGTGEAAVVEEAVEETVEVDDASAALTAAIEEAAAIADTGAAIAADTAVEAAVEEYVDDEVIEEAGDAATEAAAAVDAPEAVYRGVFTAADVQETAGTAARRLRFVPGTVKIGEIRRICGHFQGGARGDLQRNIGTEEDGARQVDPSGNQGSSAALRGACIHGSLDGLR